MKQYTNIIILLLLFFIAVCKHKIFRKIEEYSNFKTYNKVFRKMLLPFVKRHFRAFIHYYYLKRKIEFLVIILTKFFKFKVMENLYIYSQIKGADEEEIQFTLVILKIMKTLFKPHLKIYFNKLKNFQKEKDVLTKKKKEKKNEIKIIPKSEISGSVLKKENIKEKKKYLEFVELTDDEYNKLLNIF